MCQKAYKMQVVMVKICLVFEILMFEISSLLKQLEERLKNNFLV